MIEQRMHERVLRADRVAFRVSPGRGCPEACRRESAGRTSDLSEGGACIVTDIELPLDATLAVRITIMDPPSIFTHRAVVRWSRQQPEGVWRAGVEFRPESPQLAAEWRGLIRLLKQGGAAQASAA